MTDISLIPILKSEGWKVMTRSKLKSMKKEELIETIETLENNYGATIERANNSYNYGKSKIERLEKENAELKAQIEKMKCCANCTHNGSDSEIGENGDYTDYTCIQCDDFSTKENPYPNWELAE